MDCVENVDEALRCFARRSYDLLLLDTMLAGDGISALIDHTRREMPQASCAVLAHQQIEELFPLLRDHNIWNVIAAEPPLDLDLMRVSIENLLFPRRAFGLKRYLRPPVELYTHTIRDRDEKDSAIETAMRFFRKFRCVDYELNDLRLAMEELVNNSLYHAFLDTNGHSRYQVGLFETLDSNESISIEFARNNSYLACSVTDNQGNLDVSDLMNKLGRQISLEGLMDESGRGMYLVRSICDEMIVNLEPGAATQFVLLFAHQHVERLKSLLVNVIQPHS